MEALHATCLGVILLGFLIVSSLGVLHYEVVEEGGAGSFYKNIKTESGLNLKYDDSELRTLTLVFLSVNKEIELFDLDEYSGILENNRPIDRDELCPKKETCIIELAIAVQPSKYFERISITIDLLDLNDNEPKFPEAHVVTSISENARAGVLFPIQAASDPDSPDNSILQYRLMSSSDKFSLQVTKNDADGSYDLQLVLDNMLDREEQDFYQLQVVAFDGGQPAKSGSVIIDIVIEDVNDNNPVFRESSYKVEVAEDMPLNWTIVNVYATDPDAGLNGKVKYSFTPKTEQLYGHLFSIDENYGRIVLKEALDYETYKSITLGVMAEDQGPNSVPVQTLVVIEVLDINDNAPVITLNEHNSVGESTVQIPEHSSLETFVAHISVEDPDAGMNGVVQCSMESDYFKLIKMFSQEYKVVTSKAIDREGKDRRVIESFLLTIECIDQGSPSKRSLFNLTVIISDINDHTPRFPQSHFNVTIHENNEPMSFVTRTYATDPDGGPNGQITYRIQGDMGSWFKIDPVTGIITAPQVFDREEVDYYEFEVIAQDHAEEPRFSKAKVSVYILDENDEPPKFTQQRYSFEISENLPEEIEVGAVQAVDRDLPNNNYFLYYLDGQSSDINTFRIDAETGMIFSKKSLDREKQSMYHLTVLAQSDSIPPDFDKAIVTIVVADKNDNSPEILYPSHGNDTVYISKNVPVGHLLATIDAHDRDCDDDCRLTYTILNGNNRGEFIIQPKTGEILVNADLDSYEETVYLLKIRVSDNGEPEQFATAFITVEVTESIVGPQASRAGDVISSTHLAIIVGVILGCLLIAVILIISIVVIRRKNKMAISKPPVTGNNLYWPKTDLAAVPSTESTSPTDSERSGNIIDPGVITLQGEDTVAAKLAELAEREAIKTAVYTKPKLAALHPPPTHARSRSIGEKTSQDNDSGYVDHGSNDEHSPRSTADRGSTVAVKCFNPNSPMSTAKGVNSSPRKLESFSDWLHSESYHLKQEGHSYHVSDSQKDSTRKSVRFNTGNKHGTGSSISSESDIDFPLPPPDSLQILSDSKYPPYNHKLGSLV